jgi:patatin-like phospholipase/acyl hydrolase
MDDDQTQTSLPDAKKTIYALVLDGGGIRGIFVAEFLRCLEEWLLANGHCKKSIHGIFKFFSGTSTGAIIAGCLATGKYSAKYIAESIYTNENGKLIFSKKQSAVKSKLMLCPKYYGEPRQQLGFDCFGEMKMYDLRFPLIVTSYNLRCKKPYFWTNIGSGPNPRVLDAIMASTAAPTYFPAEQVFYDEKAPGKSKKKLVMSDELQSLTAKIAPGDGYIDGGVSCNSPSTITLAYLREIYKNENAIIKVLSVGTGANYNPIDFDEAKNAGGLWWLTKGDLIGITMDSSDQVNQIESELLEDENFLRVNMTAIPEGDVLLDMDNVDDENMNKLRKLGKQMFEKFLPKIKAFLGELRAPPKPPSVA